MLVVVPGNIARGKYIALLTREVVITMQKEKKRVFY